MLIVVDVEAKKARSMDVTEFLEKSIYQELKNVFSDGLAKLALEAIMETVTVSKSINCVMRDNDKLYSVDLVNMHIIEISMEMLIPTQKTDFGVKIFEIVIGNFKKCVMDFDYMVQSNKIIPNPYLYVNSYGIITMSSRMKTDNKAISKIVSEYFAGDSAENLTKELVEYSSKLNDTILNFMNMKGAHYIAIDDNGKFVIEKLERLYDSKSIPNIVKPYLMGFNKCLDEISRRIYNYIFHRFADKIDATIIQSTAEHLMIEFDFEGQKVPAIIYKNDNNRGKGWYVTKPLPFTVEKIFKLFKEGTFYMVTEDYEITQIKTIIGELSEEEKWRFEDHKDFVTFYYDEDRDKYSMYLKDNKSTYIEGDRYVCIEGEYQRISSWDGFMKNFRKHFKDEKQFYVYLVKKQ